MRSENGPEFTSRRVIGWVEDWKVGLAQIQPGRPMQNGYVESFHGRPRDWCLKATSFRPAGTTRAESPLCKLKLERPDCRPGLGSALSHLKLRCYLFHMLGPRRNNEEEPPP